MAIVDVNLDGQPSYPIAEILKGRGVPFVFATGYGSKGIDPNFVDSPVLAKPFVKAEFEKVLETLLKDNESLLAARGQV